MLYIIPFFLFLYLAFLAPLHYYYTSAYIALEYSLLLAHLPYYLHEPVRLFYLCVRAKAYCLRAGLLPVRGGLASLCRPQLGHSTAASLIIALVLGRLGVRVAHATGHFRVKPIESTQRRALRKHARCALARPPEDPSTLPQTGSSVSATICIF